MKEAIEIENTYKSVDQIKLIRLPDVLKVFPVCKVSLYTKMKNGDFPKSIKLGKNSVAWVESEVQEYLASLVSKRDKSSD